MYTWILDNGHGGVKTEGGKEIYTTAPHHTDKQNTWKKMYIHPDGTKIYEGDFNRKIVDKLSRMLTHENIAFKWACPELEDLPLKERVDRADELHRIHKNCIFVSIHGNAGKGTGFEVFTSVGQTQSDEIAEVFIEEIEKVFPQETKRVELSDGDQDKEAHFYVLRKTDCPAILTENFFMDQLDDCKLMLSEEGQIKIAKAHFNAILKIEQIG